MSITIYDLVTLLIAMTGAILGIVNFAVDISRHRPHASLSVRRALVGTMSGKVYEVVALRIQNRGMVPLVADAVGVYLDSLNGDFVEVEPVDFKGEPLVVRIEGGNSLTLRVPFETFRGCASHKLNSFFIRLADDTQFHARISRKFRNLAMVGADADEESFGDGVCAVTLRENASDKDAAKAREAIKRKCASHYHVKNAESHFSSCLPF